jgi:hypothetical protein
LLALLNLKREKPREVPFLFISISLFISVSLISFSFSCLQDYTHGGFLYFLFSFTSSIPQQKVKHDWVLLLYKGLLLDNKAASPRDPGLKSPFSSG